MRASRVRADYKSDLNPAEFSRLAARGFTGLLLPGVDGDSAGLFVFNDPLWGILIASLRETCEASGASWREVNESEFEARWAR